MSSRPAPMTRLAATCIAVLMLLLAACGGDDGAGSATSSPEPAGGDAAAANDADGNDPVALLTSPVMGDFWRTGPYESATCEPVEPPEAPDVQREWDCTVDDVALDFTVRTDLDGRMFVTHGLLPQSARTILIELVLVDLARDHGYEADIGACNARSFADGSAEFECESDLLDGSGSVMYSITVADAALGADSPFEVFDVVGP